LHQASIIVLLPPGNIESFSGSREIEKKCAMTTQLQTECVVNRGGSSIETENKFVRNLVIITQLKTAPDTVSSIMNDTVRVEVDEGKIVEEEDLWCTNDSNIQSNTAQIDEISAQIDEISAQMQKSVSDCKQENGPHLTNEIVKFEDSSIHAIDFNIEKTHTTEEKLSIRSINTPDFPLVPLLISEEPLQFELDNRSPSPSSGKILASHSSQDDFQASCKSFQPIHEMLHPIEPLTKPPTYVCAREVEIKNNLTPTGPISNKISGTLNDTKALKFISPNHSIGSAHLPPILKDLDASASKPNHLEPPPNMILPSVHIASNNISQSKSEQISNSRAYPKGRIVRVVRPFVYSAIGSLENVNQNSMGSFNRKLCLASKARGKIDGRVKSNIGYHPKKTDRGNNGRNDKQTEPSSSNLTILPNQPQSIETHNGNENCAQVQDISGDKKIVDKSEDATISSCQQPFTSKDESVVKLKSKLREKKRVTIDTKTTKIRPVEVFRPSCDAYTPRMGRREIKYKPAKERASMERISTPMGTIQRPNFRDALRRVAIIIHKHIVKIERRFAVGVPGLDNAGLFTPAMRDTFAEDNFVTPRYKCNMVNIPMARPGVIYGMRKIRTKYNIPTASDIYEFAHRIFNSVQLSSECSIICLIYVERLMEEAKVPVMANTWRPIFMCGLLLASKVWQDWSSWNVEFASVYPQFTLNSINRLEIQFLKVLKWNFYISPSLYAKYYFALRSLLEKQDFRHRYNRMVGADSRAALEAIKVSKRSERVKQEALLHLSMSM